MATDFNARVKTYFRLLEQKKEHADQVRDINAEMRDVGEEIKNYMSTNNIPAIEFGAYNLRLSRRTRKQGISEKIIRSAFPDERELETVLGKLENHRDNKVSTSLMVRTKV